MCNNRDLRSCDSGAPFVAGFLTPLKASLQKFYNFVFLLFFTYSELNNLLSPDKQRAYELRSEFEKGFDGIARRIWPNLTHVHGVVTGMKNFYTIIINTYVMYSIRYILGINSNQQ